MRSLPSVGAFTVLPSVPERTLPGQEPESNEPPATSITNWLGPSLNRAVSDAPGLYLPPQV